MTKIGKPMPGKVLIEPQAIEKKTASGIIIPDSAKEKPIKGEVVSAGPGKVADDGNRIAMSVKPGDKVIFNKYAGTEIKVDGEEFLMMREDDLLAVVEK